MDTSNSLESSFSVSIFGMVSPFSQRETACRVTKTFLANSSCEMPTFVRSCKIISFVSFDDSHWKNEFSKIIQFEKTAEIFEVHKMMIEAEDNIRNACDEIEQVLICLENAQNC